MITTHVEPHALQNFIVRLICLKVEFFLSDPVIFKHVKHVVHDNGIPWQYKLADSNVQLWSSFLKYGKCFIGFYTLCICIEPCRYMNMNVYL